MRKIDTLIYILKNMGESSNGRLRLPLKDTWGDSDEEKRHRRRNIHAVEVLVEFGLAKLTGVESGNAHYAITELGYDFLNVLNSDRDCLDRIKDLHAKGVPLRKAISDSQSHIVLKRTGIVTSCVPSFGGC